MNTTPSPDMRRRTHPALASTGGVLLLLVGLLVMALPVRAQDTLLDQARQEINAGRAADAFALLSPHEPQRAGDPNFDYLLGAAALDSGHPTNAVFALERVLALQPDNTLARALIARAYVALREFATARKELAEVQKAKNVPAKARPNIERYLTQIESAISARRTRISGYLALTLGRDTNVNAATSDTALALPAFGGAVFQLKQAAVSTAADFGTVAGGGAVSHRLRPDLLLNAGIDTWHKLVNRHHNFDTASYSAYAGLDWLHGAYTWTGAVQAQHFRVDSSAYRNAIGLLGQVRHPLDNVSEVTGYVQIARLSYPGQNLRDANRYVLGAGYSRALSGEHSPVVFGGAYVGAEQERHSGVPQLGHKLVGARVGGNLNLRRDLSMTVTGSVEYGVYGGNDPLFLYTRKDVTYDARLAMDYTPARAWTITPALEYVHDDSNIPVNDFKRALVGITVRRDFP